MNTPELIDLINHQISPYIKVAITDLDGLLRGKLMHKDKLLKSLKEGFGFCDVIFGWDSTDALYEKDSVTGWSKGFPDASASIDASTYRTLPWANHTPFLLADFERSLPEICPRSILKKQREKALSMGYEPKFSMEFEWYNFKKGPEQEPISGGMFGYSILRSSQFHAYWSQIFEQLEGANIPLEGLHSETGPGVMEAAIEKSDVLEAADKAVIFKTAIKEIATLHGFQASFMAKWNESYPGCSGHLHQSLWKTDRNLFHATSANLSQEAEQYLAGILYTLPFLMPIYAPTINSYKRLVPGSWAPINVSWGVENRTTACRIIQEPESQARIEFRVTASDNNPYLTMAAVLASGLYGIRNQLSLDMPEVKGNAYHQSSLQLLPKSLHEAIDRMKSSNIPAELFGKPFVEHFTMTREREVQLFDKSVTDWELGRYFEGI